MHKKTLFLVLAVAMLALLLAGCGGGGENAQSADTGGKEKVFVFAQGSDPRGLDPAFVDDGESAKVMVNIYDNLVRYKPDSTEIEPALAESWESNEDKTQWTFHLRKGVKFHDGTPFNAEAVKFSIERQLPPNRTDAMPYASFVFEPVKAVEVVDEYTVKIILKEPYAPFLANMAMCMAAPIVSPTAVKKYGDDYISHPVGTGPFKFVKWERGQSIELVANKDYWDGPPKLDKLIFKFVKENSVRASELMTGSIDAMDGVDPNDVKTLEENGVIVTKNPGMNINYLAFFCNKEPFNNPKLRQAVSHAINRDAIVEHLYQGLATKANGPLPSFIPGYDKELKPYEYNPEKAKQLLAEAGYPNGLKVTLLTYTNPRPYNPVGQKLAEAIQNDLKKVGIDVEIRAYPWKEYKQVVSPVIVKEGDMMIYGWIGDNGDPDNFLTLLDSKEIAGSLNSAKYANEKVDKLLVEGRKEFDMAKRAEIYSELQQILVKDAPWVFISHATAMTAQNSSVENFNLHPTGVIYFHKVDKK
ncbi:peptide/nickel transport system substrate-binding protein [Desulfohalotomaculum tongense]|uniref:ABC transporter substrate-binding protein n=1 Tax=Desulforadius tongensis TaxID=1216062 RepID=UPI00195DB5FD|nr:ABC transporter substrate-binding protein [Desulforadius tongensis]MBM7856069.1 peptide/nickel transport system substrate-binding protein [Desulforadius tongensis]